jgi:hypothetical protein
MAQNKKRKKTPAKKSPDVRKRILNKTFVDKAYIAVKKVLRAYGLDPDIFDRLSKYRRSFFLKKSRSRRKTNPRADRI